MENLKQFTLKFIDIMIGIVLGLGFQSWSNIHDTWQYIAFFFAYLSIVDYWIDYIPTIRKFPPKNEVDLLADVGILFLMFLLIYATQFTIIYFLIVYAVFRLVDNIWMARIRYQYSLNSRDKLFFNTWLVFGSIEGLVALALISLSAIFHLMPLLILVIFIIFRLLMRILASFRYKSFNFS